MSIFQKSVINNHLSQLDKDQVDKAFAIFNENYSFSKIAEIQKMKEEEYQDGFLRDIFVDVFGYTLKPADNYNLAREFKNQTDGKKADGAILKNDKAIAVIELKSTKTKDLTNVTQQAFNYKNNQPECKYVITSNFQKLRFYIDYSNEYEEFDLFNLQKNDFQLLFLLLQKDNIFTDLPLKLKTETKFHEENISDKLYKDYSSFKYKIYNNLVKNNPQYDKLTLFKKSQKFLDRLLFVFFAEDTGLVPPNAISKIVEQWQLFIDNDEYFSLYSRFVKFFIHLDKGHKYKTYDLPAYNGGLFAPDEILDSITIDDEVLKTDALLLSSYDYSTEVDVNILGHIFEHSLNEIEEITAEIEGTATDKNKTKRKKDGVFYTPKYITQYIVENTIGKLCIEKREKLGILEIEFDESIKTKNGKISANGKKLFEKLQAYKDWLFDLKIVDPACGSGAFLNQALNFLINEHQQIDDIIAELTGEKLRLFDTDKTILEKNLYGVDINDESVEIAKLSLWLRTAQKGRKLSNLNNNIKCGNSLINDPEVAGEKAFNWQNEFSEIFANGGFDVVIGNPPYGAKISKPDFKFYNATYETAHYKLDTFSLFIEKSMNIIKENRVIGLIVPYTWLTIQQHSKLRKFVLKNNLQQIIDLPTKIFSDADLDTVISIIRKDNFGKEVQIGKIFTNEIKLCNSISYINIKSSADFLINVNLTNTDYKILDKIKKVNKLTDYFDVSQGYIPYRRSDLIIKYGEEEGNKIVDERLWHSPQKINEDFKQEIQGKDISRYSYSESFQFIKYGKHLAGYVDPKYFKSPRILIMEVTRGDKYVLKSCLVEKEFYNTPSIINIISKNNNIDSLKYLLTIINSSLLTWYHKKVHPKANAITSIPKILVNDVRNLPFKSLENESLQPFSEKSDEMLLLNNELQEKATRFLSRIKSNFEIEKISTKLEKFYDYDFKTFVTELKKQKVNLSLTKQDEWEEYFNSYKSEINQLQIEIEKTDKEIDQMVYQLYGLTDDEIAIVENSIK